MHRPLSRSLFAHRRAGALSHRRVAERFGEKLFCVSENGLAGQRDFAAAGREATLNTAGKKSQSKPAELRGQTLGGGDGVAVELGGEIGLAVVAAAVEHGHRDAVFDEGAEQDFVAPLDVL